MWNNSILDLGLLVNGNKGLRRHLGGPINISILQSHEAEDCRKVRVEIQSLIHMYLLVPDEYLILWHEAPESRPGFAHATSQKFNDTAPLVFSIYAFA